MKNIPKNWREEFEKLSNDLLYPLGCDGFVVGEKDKTGLVTYCKKCDWSENEHFTKVEQNKRLKQFISKQIKKAKQEGVKAKKQNIGMLRQWLNEDRIKDAKNFVTNEELETWLKLKLIEPKSKTLKKGSE